METMYKSVIDYKKDKQYFTVEFFGTLSNNLSMVDRHLKDVGFVSANVHHSRI